MLPLPLELFHGGRVGAHALLTHLPRGLPRSLAMPLNTLPSVQNGCLEGLSAAQAGAQEPKVSGPGPPPRRLLRKRRVFSLAVLAHTNSGDRYGDGHRARLLLRGSGWVRWILSVSPPPLLPPLFFVCVAPLGVQSPAEPGGDSSRVTEVARRMRTKLTSPRNFVGASVVDLAADK